MRMKWLALGTALSAVLFGAINVRAQVLVGPNSKGGFNAYTRVATTKPFATAEEDARGMTFPGYSINGVEIIPASSAKGHLLTLQGSEERNFVASSVGFGWLGLSDDPAYGGEEGGDESGFPYPALKAGSTELRTAPDATQRGFGWVWTTGETFDYQAWNGGEPNNSGGAENSAELTASGFNDLSTQEIPSLVEWDLGLKSNPIQMNLDLSVQGGKLAGVVQASSTADFGSKDLTGESWYVTQHVEHVLRAPGVTPVQGLKATFLNGNYTSDGAWSAALANPANFSAPPSLIDKISYGGDTPNDLPAQSGFASRASGNNQENYSVQWEGEIFIPQGTVNFWDGNDDYAKLVIDGNTLIDDNNWTSWDGSQNSDTATGSFVATKTDATVDGLKGGWYPITFRGSEGGGGDNFRLVWDATDKGLTGGDVDAPYLNPNADPDTFFTVGSEFFRAVDPGLVVSTDLRLGQVDATGKAAGYMGTDGVNGVLSTNGSTINLTGLQTLTMHASIAGQDFAVTKTLDFGGTTTGIPGDIDGNGKVDLTDFGILKANFGKSGAAGAAVPEPSTLALLGLGALCGLAGVVRRGRK